MTFDFLRPSQQAILRYCGGRLGVAAVPGSGKTFTLSALAVQLIAEGHLHDDQEVLIVTLVNSAVDNFTVRIRQMLQQRGLIPYLGYRVRTLHGLAHDIVRERPSLAGLEERFQIVDERLASLICQQVVEDWLAGSPHGLDDWLALELENRLDWVRRERLPELLYDLASAFIRSCKNLCLRPEDLRARLDAAPAPLPLAEIGWWIYDRYQKALRYRGAVDFDDLIMLAYQVLRADPHYLARLQHRFPYILEDEAQDSSQMQENILRLLAGHGNWVRVGDPNQAIYETFTTADPKLLRAFLDHEADFVNQLPVSGRSQPCLIDLANHLIEWTTTSHPALICHDALLPPYIQPTDSSDPQPNPPADPQAIRLIPKKYTPEQEIEAVVKSLKAWLPEHRDWTVAVLVPTNALGIKLAKVLNAHHVDFVELLNSTDQTRRAAGALEHALDYLADPTSSVKLARTYQAWRQSRQPIVASLPNRSSQPAASWTNQGPAQPTEPRASPPERRPRRDLFDRAANLLRKLEEPETFLAPHPAADWLARLQESESPPIIEELTAFREVIRRWLQAVILPIDQLILTLAQELFTDPADLALAHKLAIFLHPIAENHPEWGLLELKQELNAIANNQRRFLGFSADDIGFDPNTYRGRVVVTTVHKSKGLEWDRVYLMSVNNYDFPGLQPDDTYPAERWFVRGQLNLQAETLAQLKAALSSDEYAWYQEGIATQTARQEYARERLRLLFVGITRARRELIITWNTGHNGQATPALAFEALRHWWEKHQQECSAALDQDRTQAS